MMTAHELSDHVVSCAELFLPLSWKMKWNGMQQRNAYNKRFNKSILVVNMDYGAVVTATQQNAVNQAVPLRLYQLVAIVSQMEKIIILLQHKLIMI